MFWQQNSDRPTRRSRQAKPRDMATIVDIITWSQIDALHMISVFRRPPPSVRRLRLARLPAHDGATSRKPGGITEAAEIKSEAFPMFGWHWRRNAYLTCFGCLGHWDTGRRVGNL